MKNNIVCADVPDWQREKSTKFKWEPSRSLVRCIRMYQKSLSSQTPFNVFIRKWAILCHHFWSVITAADIPLNSNIQGGFSIPHPNGIVIHPKAKIGPNCLVFQQVTIGTSSKPGVPVIGGHVDIGAGAKILGPVTIGDHVLIGANAVVVTDVPDHHMAVGIPAIVKPIKK